MTSKIKKIRKRSGEQVDFNPAKIENAVRKAMEAVGGEGNLEKEPEKITTRVIKELEKKFSGNKIPGIEEIQDKVEESLILSDLPKTAKSYILYRKERESVREKQRETPEKVKNLAKQSKKYFRNSLGEFIYYRTYSRWVEEEGRRETWIESVKRYIDFMRENLGDKLSEEEYKKCEDFILNQKAMPSMRLMWSAGKAARKNNVCAYNCSYIAPSKITDFAEIMFLLMSGSGVGFSAESQNVQELPIIKKQTGKKKKTHIIHDSKEGWGDAITLGLKTWYSGEDIDFDFFLLRSAGARLKTMGGRSSGPEPLKHFLSFAREKIINNQGRRLSNLDVHDIVCKIGEIVVSGGVRRSALISLSDLDDDNIRDAKKGQFFLNYPHRSMANNSAAYNEKPASRQFMEEWLALAKSGSGERGIFNRGSLRRQMPPRRWEKFKKYYHTCGSNPCGEIILRSKSFCNLTEVVARDGDTEDALMEKVKIAAILGTYQATLTNFPYISKDWKKNCEEERLLGVSVTGQWDCPAVRNSVVFKRLKEKVIRVNEEYAKRFGINSSLSVTCVKPSGTVSQLVDSSSGMHTRFAPYYLRRVRISGSDPLFKMMKDQKVPYYPEVGQTEENATTFVLEFPVASPKNSVYKNDLSALEQLKYWRIVKENFTEHNPSTTISIGPNEWIKAENWVYNNWDIVGGLSFLPRSDHIYRLAPYEEISEEEYNKIKSKMEDIDFSQILIYEKEDETTGAKSMACESAVCELKSN